MYSRYMSSMSEDFTWTLSVTDPHLYNECSIVSQALVTRRQATCLQFTHTREFTQQDSVPTNQAVPFTNPMRQSPFPRIQVPFADHHDSFTLRGRARATPDQRGCAACGKAGHSFVKCPSPHPAWVQAVEKGVRKMELFHRGFFRMDEAAQNALMTEMQLREPRVAS